MRSRARRRSVSIWDSPGPLVPMPPAEPLEVGPQPAHAGEVVLELGELDLELALGGVGVVGEDVEDHRGAVDHRHAERRLEVALLARRQLVVEGDEVGVRRAISRLQLRQLAAPEVAVGVGPLADLDHLAGGRDAGRAQQLLQLGERVAVAGRAVDDRRSPARAGGRGGSETPASAPCASRVCGRCGCAALT